MEAIANLGRQGNMSVRDLGHSSFTHETPSKPIYFALSCIVEISARITTALVKTPAAPRPANALPKMSTSILGATPQMRLPTSKMKTAKMTAALAGKMNIAWL
jgi:hypothetical protein